MAVIGGTEAAGRLWIALLCVGTLVLVGLALTPGRAAAGTVAGTLVATHGDDFARHRATGEQMWLRTAGGAHYRLRTARARVGGAVATRRATPSRLHRYAGRSVRVRGIRQGPAIAVRSIDVGRPQATSSIAKGTQKTAVMIAKFDGPDPIDKASVRSAVFTAGNSVRAYYQEISSIDPVDIRGKVGGANGDVFGVYKIKKGTGDCKTEGYPWMDRAIAKAKAAGNDMSGYDHYVLVLPESACTFPGLGELGDKHSWIYGWDAANPPVRVMVHELGHNFGLVHANSWRCYPGVGNTGARVAAQQPTGSCIADEYGDPFDPMGGGSRHFSTYNKYLLAQFSNYNTRTADAYGNYVLQPAMAKLPLGSAQMLMVRYPDTSFNYPWFSIEYRQPFGVFDDFDASDTAVNGVLVRAFKGLGTPPDSEANEPKLLDMTPWTYSTRDAALPVGKSFWDWQRNRSISVVSAGPSGATLRYAAGPPPGNSIVMMYGSVLVVSGGAGHAEGIVVERKGSKMAVTIEGSDISVGPGCGYVSEKQVECGWYGDISRVQIDGGDGVDWIAMADSKPAYIYGGTGVDVISGGSGNDRLYLNDGVRDQFVCNGGYDIVELDDKDVMGADCEGRLLG